MALYLVDTSAGRVLVRARNGHAARDRLGLADGPVVRVTEEGADGIVATMAIPIEVPVDAADADAGDWLDVSSLSTPAGKIEQRHRHTGETRLVDRD